MFERMFKESAIEEAELPDEVKVIHNGMFSDCPNLRVVKLSEGLEEIGEEALARSGIQEFTIPHNVKKIGRGAFEECKELGKLNILARRCKAKIFERAFRGCSKLKNVTLNVESQINLADDSGTQGDKSFDDTCKVKYVKILKFRFLEFLKKIKNWKVTPKQLKEAQDVLNEATKENQHDEQK